MTYKYRRPGSKGFTVIEFIIASSLTLSLIATTSVATSTLQRTMMKNRVKASVAIEATRIFETARAFNCGAAVDPSSDGKTLQIEAACTKLFGNTATPNASSDLSWEFNLSNVYVNDTRSSDGAVSELKVSGKFSTQWLQSSNSNGSCYDNTANVDASELTQPSLLLRKIELKWDLLGSPQTAIFENIESFPTNRDMYNENLAGITIKTTSGSTIQIKSISDPASKVLTRVANPCPNGTSQVFVWFPYLPLGQYAVSADKFATEIGRITLSKSGMVGVI
jgi:hypothetical protein